MFVFLLLLHIVNLYDEGHPTTRHDRRRTSQRHRSNLSLLNPTLQNRSEFNLCTIGGVTLQYDSALLNIANGHDYLEVFFLFNFRRMSFIIKSGNNVQLPFGETEYFLRLAVSITVRVRPIDVYRQLIVHYFRYFYTVRFFILQAEKRRSVPNTIHKRLAFYSICK